MGVVVVVMVVEIKNTLCERFSFNALITRRIHWRAFRNSLFPFNGFYLVIRCTIIITIIPNIITTGIIGFNSAAACNLLYVHRTTSGRKQ